MNALFVYNNEFNIFIPSTHSIFGCFSRHKQLEQYCLKIIKEKYKFKYIPGHTNIGTLVWQYDYCGFGQIFTFHSFKDDCLNVDINDILQHTNNSLMETINSDNFHCTIYNSGFILASDVIKYMKDVVLYAVENNIISADEFDEFNKSISIYNDAKF